VAPRPERFIVVGAGGHGRVVADLLRTLGHSVVGYADDDESKGDRPADSRGATVIASVRSLLADALSHAVLPGGASRVALGVGNNERRLPLFSQLRPFSAPALVHPSAAVSPDAVIGDGSVILANAVVNTAARIGQAVIINSAAVVEHDCVLGDGVHVSPGAVLCGGVTVGARTWIGAGAVVIQRLEVGADTIVGAGAVVTRALSDGIVARGNPAREFARQGAT
jgi:sugar O-acyltransferase (sialic acid O-acetyltransferase NeuD family)